MPNRAVNSVLISGASISGPALAFWLSRYGIKATVVEKARGLRGGGYPIDVRGTAVDALVRMGLYDQVRARHVSREGMVFLDREGEPVVKIDSYAITGAETGRDIEIRRGDLAEILYGATRDTVRYKFSNSIRSLSEHETGVGVVFADGEQEAFDLVVGADGLHSNTRSLIFGNESEFERYIGYCFAGFTVREPSLLRKGNTIYNLPGRMAAISISVTKDDSQGFGLLAFKYPVSPFKKKLSDGEQRELTAGMFEGGGWLIPEMVGVMRKADDLFFDSISQIHMPSWSKGRVVLAGDAAHATSFLSGQGSSMALVGAYVLAGEIATNPDYRSAFAAYERVARPFIEANQALVGNGTSTMIPNTYEELEQRNRMFKAFVDNPDSNRKHKEKRHEVHSSLKLPGYE